jgi:hypothetical protein
MAKGQKTGGRTRGVPNRRTAEIVAKAEASGLMPLDYMLSVMRNEAEEQAVRLDAAKNAAPYVHAKLQSVDANVKANIDGSITFTWQPPQ